MTITKKVKIKITKLASGKDPLSAFGIWPTQAVKMGNVMNQWWWWWYRDDGDGDLIIMFWFQWLHQIVFVILFTPDCLNRLFKSDCFSQIVYNRLFTSIVFIDCFHQIVYTSGILGIDHATGKLIEGVRLQVLSSFKKIERWKNHKYNNMLTTYNIPGYYKYASFTQCLLFPRLAKCLKTWSQSSRWWMPTWRGAWRRPATWPTLKMLRLC